MCGGNTPFVEGEKNPLGKKIFNFLFIYIHIYIKDTPKYVKLIVESCVSDNLKSNFPIFFLFLTKKNLKGKSFRSVLENRMKDNKLIYFVHS